MSKLVSGKNNGFYGRKHTDETKEKLRLVNLGGKHPFEHHDIHRKLFLGKGNPFYGRTHSDKTKQLISKQNSKMISIDSIIFISIRDGSMKLGIGNTTICYRLKSANFGNYKYI